MAVEEGFKDDALTPTLDRGRTSKFGYWFRVSEVCGDGGSRRRKILLPDDDSSFGWHGAVVGFVAAITGGGHHQLKKPFVQTCIGGKCVSWRKGFAWESVPNEGLMPQDWLWRRRMGGKLGPNQGPIGNDPKKLVSSLFWSVRHYLTFFLQT